VDRALLLDRGRLVASGPCRDVLTPPALADVFGTRAEISWPGPMRVQAAFPR
jgi:ABC-type cobalamin transport system ATPase subunit